jgi:hypothetical protein
MPKLQPQTSDAISRVVQLRNAERHLSDPQTRTEVASARDFLEGLIGPTVRVADAARVLGISQPSLHRWIELGEVAAVRTPEGRREVPLSELVELLEEVDKARSEGTARPVGHVIRERRRAAESIDLDRILPRRRARGHRTPELQSLAYHRVVAERLSEHIVEQAGRRLEHWLEEGRIHPQWAQEWERLLAMPLERIAKEISSDSQRARALRQTSPFAGVLTEQERRRLVQAVEDRASA